MKPVTKLGDVGLDWLDGSGPHSDVVLSTRVRLARNLQAHAFPTRLGEDERRRVWEQIGAAADASELLKGGAAIELSAVPAITRRVLLERHLISRELAGGVAEEHAPVGAGLYMRGGGELGAMVNEEDHLRLQALRSGLRLQEAYQEVERLDEELGARLAFAFHPEFGFLTSCPTNVGTGLRASLLVHLPGLVLTKEIGKVLQGINQVGLTFRGLYGEGSEVIGNFFQISNQTTLGKSEEDLIDHLDRIVGQVIQYEMQARGVLLRDASAVIEDKIWRAFGLLTHARTLSFDEVMNLLSAVRLGVGLKLIPDVRVSSLNTVMIYSQAAHLEQAAGRRLAEGEGEIHRAAFVRKALGTGGRPRAEAETDA
ncbi:MAG: protein arginine kinase [Gemmatimonadota bacterium]